MAIPFNLCCFQILLGWFLPCKHSFSVAKADRSNKITLILVKNDRASEKLPVLEIGKYNTSFIAINENKREMTKKKRKTNVVLKLKKTNCYLFNIQIK